MNMILKPNPIRTDSSNPFAHNTMTTRLPGIILDVQSKNDFPVSIQQNLDALYHSVKANAIIPRPQLPAPDADMWTAAFDAHPNARWLETDWFFAEPYFFRQIADAVRYWQTLQDPYAPIKHSELNEATRARVENALQFTGGMDERLAFLLEQALWGNRADLSHPASQMSQLAIERDDLLVDERLEAVEHLLHGQGIVHVVCDNFGTELAMDLVLTDTLLSQDIPVIFHLKMHPTYVSDAIVNDVHHMVDWFAESGLTALAERLTDALERGQLRLAPDFFWNSSYFLNEMPPRIYNTFASSRVVILKGDMNYRRAVFDTIFPIDTPLSAIVDYVPAPLLALRTLKSDPVVGVPIELAQRAEQAESTWRVNGRHGVIQFVSSGKR
jgi:uncharacterized protein with ATP-grasp and redox domains